MHGLGWISSGRKTTAPGWLAWVIMRCKYVGEWYSRRGHFVPVNELMSIFEQIWETRKHIHDLKKYPQCRLHEKKSNLQFRSPAWRYGCVRPWIRNQFPENPTKVRVVSRQKGGRKKEVTMKTISCHQSWLATWLHVANRDWRLATRYPWLAT